MTWLSIPVGVAALFGALAAGWVAETQSTHGPAAERRLARTESRANELHATRRGNSLRVRLSAAVFARRFNGLMDVVTTDHADTADTSEVATDNAAPAPATPAARSIIPVRATAALSPRETVARPGLLASLPSASSALPDVEAHTAVYDIAAHTLYLPGGEKLEAHSGIGYRLDDPRYVDAKNRGPTPPNVYALALREGLFHGVRALRLTPIGDGKMFGRDGILAHSYMLGPTGQSNGCIAVRDYPALLRAFLSGEVERLVVVDRLPKPNVRIASLR